MNRRTLLKGSAAAAASLAAPRFLSPASAQSDFPPLTITVHDDRFELPDELTAGRYAVEVVNASSAPIHAIYARLPDGVTQEDLLAAAESDDDPEWFDQITGLGMPDWGGPGSTHTGIIDVHPGLYVAFSIFTPQEIGMFTATGEFGQPAEPASDLEIGFVDMAFDFAANELRSGPQRLKMTNAGALPHEIQFLEVPEGTTTDQIIRLFALPEDGSATPEADLVELFDLWTAEYLPVAACAMLGSGASSWLDADLPAGTYAAVCPLPFPAGPHVMEGMVEILTLS